MAGVLVSVQHHASDWLAGDDVIHCGKLRSTCVVQGPAKLMQGSVVSTNNNVNASPYT